jgi:hypothetical protein
MFAFSTVLNNYGCNPSWSFVTALLDGTKASRDSLHVVPFLYITYTLRLHLHSEERCFQLLIMLTLKQLTATYPHHLVIELHNIFYLRETEGSTWGHPRFLVGFVSLIVLDFCIMLFSFSSVSCIPNVANGLSILDWPFECL